MQKAHAETGNCSLKVTIISDSSEASHYAKLMAERLVPDLRPEIVPLSNVWQFEVPSGISISQEERDTILQSDVIIVSAHGVAALPRHIKTWFQDIPENSIRPFALVALLDQEQGTLPRLLTLRNYLREITRDRQTQFSRPEDHWESKLEHDAEEFAHPQSLNPKSESAGVGN